MHPISVWLIGDIRNAEFAPAIDWLHNVAACVDIVAGCVPASIAYFPAAIVIFQARPGTISQTTVERLHRRAPLARLIAVVGTWCEGELRSGRPLHGLARVPWHQWSIRLPAELGIGHSESAGASLFPRTSTPVDRLLRLSTRLKERSRIRGLAAICSTCRSTFEALAEACAVAGLQSRWQPPEDISQVEDPDLVLIDGRQSLISLTATHFLARPCILLIDWPRAGDLALAQERGIQRVLAQPFLLEDFAAAVDALLPRPAIEGRAASAA